MDQSNRQTRLEHRRVHITCVVPVFNEASGIHSFLLALHQKITELTQFGKILVVDDGSHDETVSVIQKLLKDIPIQFICFSRHFGKEMALMAGLKAAARAEVVFLIDADFQHPLELLPIFLQQWAKGIDMVYGVQQDRQHERWDKRVLSQIFYRWMTWFADINLPPNAGDFRLLDSVVVNALNQCPERNRFMKGLYSWVGFKNIAVPFTAPLRTSGKSAWHFRKLVGLALTGIISFSDIPLRMWGIIGFIISGATLIYGVCVVLSTWLYGADVPGYPTIVAAMMFLGGVQLLSIGILGEYIARIFNEVKQRPPYVIAHTHNLPPMENDL